MKKILFISIALTSCLSVSAQQKVTSGHITFEESSMDIYNEGEAKKRQVSFKFYEERARMERREGENWAVGIADAEANTIISYGEQKGNKYSSTNTIRPEPWTTTKEEMEAEWGRELSDEEFEAFLNSERGGITCELIDSTKVIAGYTCHLMRRYQSSGMEEEDPSQNRTDFWYTKDIVAPFQVLADELYQYNMEECELPGLCLAKTVVFFGTELQSITTIEVVPMDYSDQKDELFNMTVPEEYPDIEEQMEQMMEEMMEGLDEAMEGLEENMEGMEDEYPISEKLDEDIGYGDFKIYDPYKKHEKNFSKVYPTYDEILRTCSIDVKKAGATKLHGLNVQHLILDFDVIHENGLEVNQISFFCVPNEDVMPMLEEIYGIPTSTDYTDDGQIVEATWYGVEGVSLELYNGREFDEKNGYMSQNAGEYLVLRFALNY